MAKDKKGIRPYLIKVFNGMAQGLFASLIIGLIIIQIGKLTGASLLVSFGTYAQYMMGPAIGAGVALSLGAQGLSLVSAITLGALGAGTLALDGSVWSVSIGEPVGALLTSLVGVEISKRVSGKTDIDIILVPMITILAGGLFAHFVSGYIVSFTSAIGALINHATELRPLAMGTIISVVMGMTLTAPMSSAALGISLGLEGLAAGAACVGCACNMVGFAVGSFEDNGLPGLISQGLGTSMLQMGNIIKKPIIWLPSIITSAILGAASTTIVPIMATKEGSGMGTSGLVGVFSAIEAMGTDSGSILAIVSMMVIFPALIAFGLTYLFRKKGWIKKGDMKI